MTPLCSKLLHVLFVLFTRAEAENIVTFDHDSLIGKSPSPLVTGKITHLNSALLAIYDSRNAVINHPDYEVTVSHEKWAYRPKNLGLSPGKYNVELSQADNEAVATKVIATDMLTVLPKEKWERCSYACERKIPAILSLDPIAGAVGTKVQLSGVNFSAKSELFFDDRGTKIDFSFDQAGAMIFAIPLTARPVQACLKCDGMASPQVLVTVGTHRLFVVNPLGGTTTQAAPSIA